MDIHRQNLRLSWVSVFGRIRGLNTDSKSPMSMQLSGFSGYFKKILVRLWRNIQNEGRKVGDSGRFEKPSQDKESDFVVDYAPPEMFEAGIILQEMGTEGDTYCTMYVYFAPEEHLPVYMDSMKYDLQKVSIRKIFVDTEEYLIKVNEKTKKFYAGEDGCWGSYTELYRKENGERLTDAVIVFLCMPDEMKFQEMEAVIGELFEKLPVIDKEKKETGQEPKRTR